MAGEDYNKKPSNNNFRVIRWFFPYDADIAIYVTDQGYGLANAGWVRLSDLQKN
jgi:hypothetical protein